MASVAPRIVYDYCLAVFKSARGSLTVEGVQYAVEPKRVVILPPFQQHSFAFEAGTDLTHVAVHFDLAPQFPDSTKIAERSPYAVRFTDGVELPIAGGCDLPDCYTDALTIAAMYKASDAISLLKADAALFRLVASTMIRSTDASESKSSRGAAVVDRVLSYIESRLAHPFTIDDLAVVANLSTVHLTRLFRTKLGYPPMAYLARMRMIKARELLRDERLSVKKIAAAVGYSDAKHFARAFRLFDGLSPSQHRGSSVLDARTNSLD